MSEEFEIDGVTYRAGPMDARAQLHVCRRITPLVTTVPDILKPNTNILASILPFAEALAGMEDKDVDYILDKCLSVVQRKQDGGREWAKVWNTAAQRPMFEDITVLSMLKITARVIVDIIGPFLPALAPKLNGAAGASASKP